jgi:hypothetical protein
MALKVTVFMFTAFVSTNFEILEYLLHLVIVVFLSRFVTCTANKMLIRQHCNAFG